MRGRGSVLGAREWTDYGTHLDVMNPLEHGEEGRDDRASVGLCIALWIELEALRVVVCPESNKGAGEGDQKG